MKKRRNTRNGINPADWIPLVWRIINLHRFDDSHQRNDAAQEAFVCLMRAAVLWRKHARGKPHAKFMTYAWSCIRGAISNYRKKERDYRWLKWIQRANWYLPKRPRTTRLRLFSECHASFSQGWNDLFAVECDLDEMIETEDQSKIIHDQLNTLAPREKRVIQCRFGLGGQSAMSLAECGREFGVTRARVRQIEMRAINKLRKRPRWGRCEQGQKPAPPPPIVEPPKEEPTTDRPAFLAPPPKGQIELFAMFIEQNDNASVWLPLAAVRAVCDLLPDDATARRWLKKFEGERDNRLAMFDAEQARDLAAKIKTVM